MDKQDVLHSALDKLQQASALLQNPSPQPDMPVQLEILLEDAISALRNVLGIRLWPEPTVERPDLDTLEVWMWEDGGCEATDGCWIEPDGTCQHGHPSWLLKLGLI